MTTPLTHCGLEPIHLPSAIQEFGALLVVDLKNFHPVQVSANCEMILGHGEAHLLRHPVRNTLGDKLENALKKKQSRYAGEGWSANICYQENIAILEVEKADSIHLKLEAQALNQI